MHHFGGRLTLINQIINNNWFLSIPSSVEYSEHFQQMVKKVPIQNLLCETDSPFLHPERKKNNTPTNVLYAYRKLAEIKELSLQEVEKQIENIVKAINNLPKLYGFPLIAKAQSGDYQRPLL